MPKKYLIKSPPAASGPLEKIKTGGEDPSRLSGAIAYVTMLKHEGLHPPGCLARLYITSSLCLFVKLNNNNQKMARFCAAGLAPNIHRTTLILLREKKRA